MALASVVLRLLGLGLPVALGLAGLVLRLLRLVRLGAELPLSEVAHLALVPLAAMERGRD